MTRMERLKSDLKDAQDPKVLSKYPHLANAQLVKELESKIAQESLYGC